jgi:hypothetical protein
MTKHNLLVKLRERLALGEFSKDLVLEYITVIHDIEIEERRRRQTEKAAHEDYEWAEKHQVIRHAMLSWKCILLADLSRTPSGADCRCEP